MDEGLLTLGSEHRNDVTVRTNDDGVGPCKAWCCEHPAGVD
jgi:hypothetical protein